MWSTDFITELPLCGRFNGIYTCVDKLTKFVKPIPVSIGEGALSAPEVACLFFEYILQLFGIPHVVLHNFDTHFTAKFSRCLWELLGSRVALSSAYHPQSDGQTEHTHQTVDRLSAVLYLSGGYLRLVGANSLAQSNWLSIQLFRILQVFCPVGWFLARSCVYTSIL